MECSPRAIPDLLELRSFEFQLTGSDELTELGLGQRDASEVPAAIAQGANASRGANTALHVRPQNNSTSPKDTAQLDRGGIPASVTARHVKTGPPWGNGTNPARGLRAPILMA